jgi:CBS domain-containing protein
MVIFMNIFKRLLIRTYQKVLYLATFFLSFKEPKIIKGENSLKDLCELINQKRKNKVLLVTDNGLHSVVRSTGYSDKLVTCF